MEDTGNGRDQVSALRDVALERKEVACFQSLLENKCGSTLSCWGDLAALPRGLIFLLRVLFLKSL